MAEGSPDPGIGIPSYFGHLFRFRHRAGLFGGVNSNDSFRESLPQEVRAETRILGGAAPLFARLCTSPNPMPSRPLHTELRTLFPQETQISELFESGNGLMVSVLS